MMNFVLVLYFNILNYKFLIQFFKNFTWSLKNKTQLIYAIYVYVYVFCINLKKKNPMIVNWET